MPTSLAPALAALVLAADAPDAGRPVQLKPGEPGSKLAPRFSPKGTQFALAPKPVPGLAGFDHLEGRVRVGPDRAKGDGLLVVLARSEKGKPYDRLAVDAGRDGSVADDAPLAAAPRLTRDKWWTTFEVTLKVPHGAEADDYPVSVWVVADKPDDAPAVARFSRRGFRTGDVALAGGTFDVVLSDADNDGVYGRGDWWGLVPRAGGTGAADTGRAVGDYAWAGGKAYKLALDGTAGRAARVVPFDPGVTEAEDAAARDKLRADREAPRAAKPMTFRADADAALKDAAAGKAPAFLKFETDWCGPCKQMHALVFPSKAVTEAAAGVVCVVVDGDKRKDLVEKYAVKGYPTGVLLGPDGAEVARFSGYQSVKETAALFAKIPTASGTPAGRLKPAEGSPAAPSQR